MKKLMVLLVGVAFFASCSDLNTTSSKTFIIRGKALKGARNRTPLAGGYVQLIAPKTSAWQPLTFGKTSGVPNKAVTAEDGSYTLRAELDVVTEITGRAVFVAITGAGGTPTMISEVPVNRVTENAEVNVDVNASTTTAGALICPGGVYPPPNGAYCYQDMNDASTTKESIVSTVDTSLAGTNSTLEAPDSLSWSSFVSSVYTDGVAFNQLKTIAGAVGFSSLATVSSASSLTTNMASLPKITRPVAGVDDNNPEPEPTSTSDSGGSGCFCPDGRSCSKSADCGFDDGVPMPCGCIVQGLWVIRP